MRTKEFLFAEHPFVKHIFAQIFTEVSPHIRNLANIFNLDKAKGGFHQELNFNEAQAAHDYWGAHQAEIEGLSPEQLNGVHSREELEALLAGQLEQEELAELENQVIKQKALEAKAIEVENLRIREVITAAAQQADFAEGDELIPLDSDGNGVYDAVGARTAGGQIYYISEARPEGLAAAR